ncbi:MAG: hypothetical protein WHU10_13275, partial [Fimbriimonadales bacterium]
MGDSDVRMIVCTVGGTPEPIVLSLQRDQPQGVLFVVSPNTLEIVDAQILPSLQVKPNRVDTVEVDHDRLADAFHAIVQRVRDKLRDWRVQPSETVADLTGGTKAMAGALALAAAVLGLRTRYVAGGRPGGMGAVDPGTEVLVDEANPFEVYA